MEIADATTSFMVTCFASGEGVLGIPPAEFFHLHEYEKYTKLDALKFPQMYCMTLSGSPLPKVKNSLLAKKHYLKDSF